MKTPVMIQTMISVCLCVASSLAQADDLSALAQNYQAIQNEARVLAGPKQDSLQRAVLYNLLQFDSGGNYILGVSASYALQMFNAMAHQKIPFPVNLLMEGDLSKFNSAMGKATYAAFIDNYTNYYFTKYYGHQAGAVKFVPPSTLDALNLIHDAASQSRELSKSEKYSAFEAIYWHEQESMIAPILDPVGASLGWPVKGFLASPPATDYVCTSVPGKLKYQNFFDTQNRFATAALATYQWLADDSWNCAIQAMRQWGNYPLEFYDRPEAYVFTLREKILSGKSLRVFLP